MTKFEINAGINVLCGVGLLSTPYAAKEGGWIGLSILVIFGVLSFYTGMLLRYCLDSQPELETYPDIGQAAFGKLGRIAISVSLLYTLSSFFSLYIEMICKLRHLLARCFAINADNTVHGTICK